MPYSSETTIILNQALENQNNLEMALDVCSVCDDLRGILIIEFVEKLKTCLARCPNMSQYEFTTNEFKTSPLGNSTFGFAKNSWQGRYAIGIQRWKNAIIYGVYNVLKEENEEIPSLMQP